MLEKHRLALAEHRCATLAADLLLAHYALRRNQCAVDEFDVELPADVDDTVFITYCFKWLLRRGPDEGGLVHFQNKLRHGAARMDVIREIVGGSEFQEKLGFGRPAPIKRGMVANARVVVARWLTGRRDL